METTPRGAGGFGRGWEPAMVLPAGWLGAGEGEGRRLSAWGRGSSRGDMHNGPGPGYTPKRQKWSAGAVLPADPAYHKARPAPKRW